MEQTEIIEIVREALLLSIQLAAPVMLVGLIVGVTIALFQALTQVQEITLVFVPKILAIFLAIFVLFPGMVAIMTAYMQTVADRIIGIQ
ncbi:MAG TPA: flagellar biosynthetic protein FliQ [Alphaproteobacteria bacterium]|jgi:flagellar biosynthetic protein FliQ